MRIECKTAAKWWADQLRGIPKHDNGVAMHSMLAMMVAAKQPAVSDEQIGAFETHLGGLLDESWALGRQYGPVVGVDYGPCRLLRQALDAAGIDGDMRLPIKTTMRVEPGSVKVACGYGAEPEDVPLLPS